MVSLAVGQHIAGGYFVARSTPGSPPWMPPEFSVRRSISASSELVPLFPRPTWADFDAVAAQFGLRVDQRGPAGQLADELFAAGRLGWPDVFFELSDAQMFCDRFAGGRDDAVVIGVGLVADQVDAFLTEVESAAGVSDRLGRHEPLDAAGTPLGYELLGIDVPPFCSWAVDYLPATVHERLGIGVNHDGLIPSLNDATRAADFASRPDVPSCSVRWRPWLLVQYSPTPCTSTSWDRA